MKRRSMPATWKDPDNALEPTEDFLRMPTYTKAPSLKREADPNVLHPKSR
jgi:hypothetical protein